MPLVYDIQGDRQVALSHLPITHNRMFVLKNQMKLGKQAQAFGQWTKLDDGTIYRVSSVYGMDKIEIYSPFYPVVSKINEIADDGLYPFLTTDDGGYVQIGWDFSPVKYYTLEEFETKFQICVSPDGIGGDTNYDLVESNTITMTTGELSCYWGGGYGEWVPSSGYVGILDNWFKYTDTCTSYSTQHSGRHVVVKDIDLSYCNLPDGGPQNVERETSTLIFDGISYQGAFYTDQTYNAKKPIFIVTKLNQNYSSEKVLITTDLPDNPQWITDLNHWNVDSDSWTSDFSINGRSCATASYSLGKLDHSYPNYPYGGMLNGTQLSPSSVIYKYSNKDTIEKAKSAVDIISAAVDLYSTTTAWNDTYNYEESTNTDISWTFVLTDPDGGMGKWVANPNPVLLNKTIVLNPAFVAYIKPIEV